MTEAFGQKKREPFLDIFKSLLTVGMIHAHVIQFLIADKTVADRIISQTINLTTFSGFVLAYGMGIGLARAQRPHNVPRALVRVLQIYLAYFLSAIGYVVLVEKSDFDTTSVLQVLFMTRLTGYSAFLATFFVLGILVTFCRPEMARIASSKATLALCFVLSIASTFVVFSNGSLPFLGTIIGTTARPSFPFFPYSLWFYTGYLFTQRRFGLNKMTFVAAAGLTAVFLTFAAIHHGLPSRFPPSFLWVIGPSLILWIYLCFSHVVETTAGRAVEVISRPGEFTLFFLTVSNLILFSITYFWGPLPINQIGAIVISAVMICLLTTVRLAIGALARRARAEF